MANLEMYAPPADDTDISDSADPQRGELHTPGAPAVPVSPGDRPAGLPENYKTVADLAAAYAEAERKITEYGQKAAGTPGDVPSFESLMEQADSEYRKDSTISEATLSAIETHYKIPRARQLKAAEDAAAVEDMRADKILTEFGGDAGFTEFSTWAQAAMSQAELTTLNTTIKHACQTGDMATASLMIQGALGRFRGSQPARVEEGQAALSANGVAPYASKMEAMQAIASQAYRMGDRKFHETHKQRLKLSGPLFT